LIGGVQAQASNTLDRLSLLERVLSPVGLDEAKSLLPDGDDLQTQLRRLKETMDSVNMTLFNIEGVVNGAKEHP